MLPLMGLTGADNDALAAIPPQRMDPRGAVPDLIVRTSNRPDDGEPAMDVRAVIDTYLRAWTTQDPDLIVTIFTHDATYHERVLEAPIRTRAGIWAYWQSKVVEGQANIEARLLNLYTATDGITVIAEWEAMFDDCVQGQRKRMREVAILEFEGERIASLREYWASEIVG